MFFEFKENKVVILGLNYISITLAHNLSVNRDVVILYNKDNNIKINNYNIDVMIEEVKFSLLDQLNNLLDDCVIFISLTEDDEYNIFTAQMAKKLGAKYAMAGVYNNDYLKVNIELDLIFNPLNIIIDRINAVLESTRLSKIKNLIPGKVNITQIRVKNDDTFSYRKLGNLKLEDGLIIAIKRDKRMIIPDSNIKLLPNDCLYILYKRCFTDWIKLFTPGKFSKKKMFIIGSGIIGEYFIDYWKNIFDPIIVIEPELKKCNRLATRFEKPLILHGEVTDLQLLREEGIDKKSIYLACSDNDFYNMLSGFGAGVLGCNNVLTLLNNPENREIAGLLKLNKVIFKPGIISDYIISFIKTGFKKIDKYILGEEIYTAKVKIDKNFRVNNTKLKDLKLPNGVLIGVIIRDGKVILPAGETTLNENDRAIVFFDHKLENKIGRIFS